MARDADEVKFHFKYEGLPPAMIHNLREIERVMNLQVESNQNYTSETESVDSDLGDHMADTDNPHSVDKTDVSLGNVVNTLHKFDATAAPTASDDSGDGYSVGSMWFDTTNDKAYGCLDSTATAAVWTELTQSGGGGSSFTTRLSVSMSTDWELASGSALKVTGFDTVDEDDNGDWDAANKRWDCPTTGWYLCITGIEVEGSSTGTRVSYFYENGTRMSRESSEPHAGDGCSWTHTKMLYLTSGRYLEVYAYQSSGSGKDIIAGVGSFFQILGPILT